MTTNQTLKRIARVVGLILLWMVTLLATAVMGKAGFGKFESTEGWQYWFQRWGYAPWFVYVIGVAELGGALLLLIPRMASYAAALLIAVMIGAFITVSTNQTDLSAVDPVINSVILAVVLAGRWTSRWRPLSQRRPSPTTTPPDRPPVPPSGQPGA